MQKNIAAETHLHPSSAQRAHSQRFARNPIVYHILIDRFCHVSGTDQTWYELGQELGTFHGGNLAGITQKIAENWFSDLGVNALWLSMPFEQIHGWIPGGSGSFAYFAYHGYWPLDFTCLDPRFGTEAELAALVSSAHRKGIKVILDVVMSHVGYPDLQSCSEYLPASVRPGWQHARPQELDEYLNRDGLGAWWGTDWIYADLPNYDAGGADDLTVLMHGLPRLKTDSEKCVGLPPFLQNKADSRAQPLIGSTVRDYLITWLVRWVRDFGIDGFRCDSAKHVSLAAWAALKSAASDALVEWKMQHPDEKSDDDIFWMTGEVFGHGIEESAYYQHGFDNLINFDFQEEMLALFEHVQMSNAYSRSLWFFRLDKIFTRYSAVFSRVSHYQVLSYLSSHDTRLFPREHLHDAATALLLCPGGVQIFYGDEVARASDPMLAADPSQATRSNMHWNLHGNAIDSALLSHWQKLGRFRARHSALACGTHQKILDEPYVFARRDASNDDCVLVAMGHDAHLELDVTDYFAEGSELCDAYTGARFVVKQQKVLLQLDGLALLERAGKQRHSNSLQRLCKILSDQCTKKG